MASASLLQHIHTPDDGRSHSRQVYVNGRAVKQCFYADTRRGIARCNKYPLKIHKYGKRLINKTYRGEVTVREKDENPT